ncbi:MAG: hypothetical protein WC614_13560 [bacterium]
MGKIIKTICIFAILSFSTFANAVTIDDIAKKLENNVNKIKDMQADVEMKTDVGEGENIVQKMQIVSKGMDKAKVVSTAPQKQTIIMNNKKMQIESFDGKKTVINKDSLLQGQTPLMSTNDMNLQRGIVDFLKDGKSKILNSNGNIYTLEIIPSEKDKNPLMGKVELQIDYAKGLVMNQKIYSNMGIIITDISYKKIGNIWTISEVKTISPVSFGKNKTATIIMRYNNVKINQNVTDKVFAIE